LIKAEGILQQALRRHGLDREIARYSFVLRWPEIVGEEIAKRTKPEFIRNGTLHIRVSDSIWAQELSFQKDVILKRLKRHLNQNEVLSNVQFFVGR
jgi:predicted nucleic acid-binding Zn ribbon protein